MAEKITDPVTGLALDFVLARHDRLPSLRGTALDDAGSPVDLTAATGVTFTLRPYTAPGAALAPVTFTSAGTIDGDSLQYDWAATDTATSGIYRGQFTLTFPGPKTLTVPNNAYLLIGVYDDLDAVA